MVIELNQTFRKIAEKIILFVPKGTSNKLANRVQKNFLPRKIAQVMRLPNTTRKSSIIYGNGEIVKAHNLHIYSQSGK